MRFNKELFNKDNGTFRFSLCQLELEKSTVFQFLRTYHRLRPEKKKSRVSLNLLSYETRHQVQALQLPVVL